MCVPHWQAAICLLQVERSRVIHQCTGHASRAQSPEQCRATARLPFIIRDQEPFAIHTTVLCTILVHYSILDDCSDILRHTCHALEETAHPVASVLRC